MKIRIEPNSLLLRLRKSEVELFAKNEVFSELISFGNESLVYRLKMCLEDEISSFFSGNIITVNVPKEIAMNWANTDLISLENQVQNLHILIEKDFECTLNEDVESEKYQSDCLENPKSIVD